MKSLGRLSKASNYASRKQRVSLSANCAPRRWVLRGESGRVYTVHTGLKNSESLSCKDVKQIKQQPFEVPQVLLLPPFTLLRRYYAVTTTGACATTTTTTSTTTTTTTSTTTTTPATTTTAATTTTTACNTTDRKRGSCPLIELLQHTSQQKPRCSVFITAIQVLLRSSVFPELSHMQTLLRPLGGGLRRTALLQRPL